MLKMLGIMSFPPRSYSNDSGRKEIANLRENFFGKSLCSGGDILQPVLDRKYLSLIIPIEWESVLWSMDC